MQAIVLELRTINVQRQTTWRQNLYVWLAGTQLNHKTRSIAIKNNQ